MSSFKINFQPATSPVPQGYVADTGQAYSDAAGFGWVTEASLADGQPGTIPDPIAPHAGAMADRMTPGVDPRLTSYAHFAVPGAPAASPQRWAWEHTLANGWYAVTAAVGDTGGADDSVNVLNVEGQAFMAPWTPTASFKTNLVTGVVEITDGRLTLDSIGGTNTEIQYIEVKALPDITPDDGRPAVANYSALSNGVATTAGQPAQALDRATNIDPAAALAVDVTIVRSGAGVDDASFNPQTVRLYETLSGRAVAGQVNTTGGGDAIVLTPGAPLKENTSYTLRIDGVTDVSGVEFLPYSATFTTGANQASGPRTVAFSAAPQQVSASGFSSLVVAPDGMHLYAASLGGTIFRWDIDQATGALNNEQSFTDPSLAGRPLVGVVFDPASPDTLWVSSNGPGFSDASDFSGKVSKVTIAAGGAFEATVQDYVVGLPRSVRDHMSNSLSFRIDPGTGEHMLYLVQGGNTAMGAADNAWGNRPERLLGAVLEIDPTRDVSAGPIDVQTQHPDAVLPAGAGAQPGWYDPFAPDAPVKLYATGIRNAYDLVWHSNGSLYVPSNGSAAGGNTPDDPGTAVSEALSGVSTQNDLLYKVVEGRYYGHPNPVRGEYVLNGGNPTAGTDPAQVSEYPVGVAPPVSYGGFAHDFSRNRSPNGVIEYKSGVLGDALKGSLLVAEYSAGNDILWLKLDANGNVVGSDVLKDASGTPLTLNDPLDLVEHAPSGRIYVATLGNGGITLLTPEPDAPTPAPRPIYEAEAAQLSGAVSASNWIGFTGSGFADFLNPTGDSVTWTVHVAQAGTYDLGWRYALATASGPDGRPLALSVNGEAANATLAFLPTGGAFTDWGTQTAAVALRAGANTVTLTTTGKSGANIDHLAVPDAPKTTHQPIYEAEAARLNGAVSASNWTGFTGSGFADFLNPTGESITWTVRVAEAGTYDLGWRYALAAASGPDGRPLALSVNGEAATGLLPFLPTGTDFASWGTQSQAATLRAGVNTVTLTTTGKSGANIDHLAVPDAPRPPPPPLWTVYEAETAALGGAAVAAADWAGFTGAGFVDYRSPAGDSVTWTVHVAQAGTYDLGWRYALAAASGPDGRPLALSVNGEAATGLLPFLPTGDAFTDWGTLTQAVALRAGANTVTLSAAGRSGPNIDHLAVADAPLLTDPDLKLVNLDGVPYPDRLVFSHIDDPGGRSFKNTAAVRIQNTGSDDLDLSGLELRGPFAFVDPRDGDPVSIRPGGSLDVEVRFDRAKYDPASEPDIFTGQLRIAADGAVKTVEFAGFWQSVGEGGQEPTVNEVWQTFGYSTRVSLADLDRRDIYEKANPQEVLSPYWKLADGAAAVTVTQIAAFHGLGADGTEIHAPGDKGLMKGLFGHPATWSQSLLPLSGAGKGAAATFDAGFVPDAWAGDDVFGFRVGGLSSDPRLNPTGAGTVPPGTQRGHFLRFFEARDEDGALIPNTYLAIHDYVGLNYDYNDNMYVISGIAPVPELGIA